MFPNCKLRESKGHIQEALDQGLLEYEDLDVNFMLKYLVMTEKFWGELED